MPLFEHRQPLFVYQDRIIFLRSIGMYNIIILLDDINLEVMIRTTLPYSIL